MSMFWVANMSQALCFYLVGDNNDVQGRWELFPQEAYIHIAGNRQ